MAGGRSEGPDLDVVGGPDSSSGRWHALAGRCSRLLPGRAARLASAGVLAAVLAAVVGPGLLSASDPRPFAGERAASPAVPGLKFPVPYVLADRSGEPPPGNAFVQGPRLLRLPPPPSG